MKKSLFILGLGLFVGTITFVACGTDEKKTATPTVTEDTALLYTRLGGKTEVADPKNSSVKIQKGRLAIRGVIDSAILVIAGDASLKDHFATLLAEVGAGNTTGFAALSSSFTTFVQNAAGNTDIKYAGLNMSDAHNPAKNSRMGKKSSSDDFDKFIGDCATALEKNGVKAGSREFNELATALVGQKSQVVQ